MANKHFAWIFMGSMLSALSGCDVSVGHCDRDDAGDCVDLFPDDDAGDEEDGGSKDAGGKDAGGKDAGDADGDAAGEDSDADVDAGGDAGDAISVDEFCIELLKNAVAWRDALEGLCDRQEQGARDLFLQKVLAYAPDDAEGKCITARNAVLDGGKATYDGKQAMACATAFAEGFAPPPDPFPTEGINLAQYEASIAHGAPALIQIPQCRETFKGTLKRDAKCSDNFECIDGLRCLPAPGQTTTCQPALVGGTCVQSSNCADGYMCVGDPDAGGGKTCVKSDKLPQSGGNCYFSAECSDGLVCTSRKCAQPTTSVICAP